MTPIETALFHLMQGHVDHPELIERGALTTLRNSQLLNAHSLIIAEKANPRDMEEYKDMISFVTVAQVPNEFNRMMRMSTERRQALADDRAARQAHRLAGSGPTLRPHPAAPPCGPTLRPHLAVPPDLL